MVYDDPYHDSNKSCRIATTIVKRILKFKPINIKLDTVIHELEAVQTIPQLQITFSSADFTNTTGIPKINTYRIKTSNFKKQIIEFASVPKEEVLEVIEDDDCGDYSKKEITITIGKKQYKVRREIIDGLNAMKLTIESIFNSSTIVMDEEMDKLYDPDFIIEKLQPILSNYISDGTLSST